LKSGDVTGYTLRISSRYFQRNLVKGIALTDIKG